MTTPMPTSNNNSQMHNDIMAAGSRDRPSMLATSRYAQWQSRFMRYIDTRPNSKELRQCIYDGPYVMTEILVPEKPEIATKEAVPAHTINETSRILLLKNVLTLMLKLKVSHLTKKMSRLISFGKLYQNEVNETRAENLARNANRLALVDVAQHYPEYHNQSPKPHKSIAPSTRQITASKLHTSTRHKGKEIAKPVTPPSESASGEDNDPEQA
uniref:Integrase, catalytic region, zinc finger, CCHC-type, peptidase aspartic, catalytic n=1 Tax=Tanacetum cinerariifolium TaxID=118510 RepID=A0A6L2JDF4_TANCI|nr:hypothetical protein [Tanacetum cinerariifolium]